MTSRVIIKTNGVTRLFTVPFPYIHEDHVMVSVNHVLKFRGVDYNWVGPSAIEFTNAPTQGTLELTRQTPATNALVQFRNGAALTEEELNLAVLQNLYLVQELRDYYDALINGALDNLIFENGNSAGSVIDKVIEEILGSEALAILNQRITDIDTNANTINSQRIRLDSVEDIIDGLLDIDGGSIATFLQAEQQARIEGDTALVDTLRLIGAVSGDSQAFIIDMDSVKVSPTESIGTRLAVLLSRIDNNQALIAQEQIARTTADSALASQITNVVAEVGNTKALITAETTARATADTAATLRMDGMLSTINGQSALILNEQQTRATADSALASSVQTLQTSVNGNTASIQTQQAVINGLSAQYSVKLDVNGYVAGFGLYNQGGSASFIILADKFALVTPGKTPQVPFAVDANGVYMNNAYIRNLTVDKITGGNIGSQWNLNNTGGRIVLDTGTYMKVIGVGFGANSDLIEWFGPKMAINLCTKANGTTWVGMNGDAYFGGSLSAGTLYNAQQTTNTQVPTEVICGPFATNGGPKVVVVSFTFAQAMTSNAPGIGGFQLGAGTTYATIQLYRKIGTAAEQLIATFTLNGTEEISNEPDGADGAKWIISGAYTYTDNVAGTADRTFRAVVTARGQRTITHSTGVINSSTVSQKLGIISTEE